MPKKLKIYQYTHPVLNQKAIDVKNVKNSNIQTLIDDMIFTCEKAGGMGIAAPQVGYSLSIFILMSHPNSRYPYAPQMPITAIINPKIIEYSAEQVSDWEGCLSIPDKRGKVKRSRDIYVSYFDREGQEVFTDYEGFLARVFQHEYDHLKGILFFQRLQNQPLFTNDEFQKLIKHTI